MDKKKVAICTGLIIVFLGIIILPAVFNRKEVSNKEEGQIVIREDKLDYLDDLGDANLTETGGDLGGANRYDFQFVGAEKLFDKHIEIGFYEGLCEAFLMFKQGKPEYKPCKKLIVDADSFVDNDSQSYFEFTDDYYKGAFKFKAIYNKKDMSITIKGKE